MSLEDWPRLGVAIRALDADLGSAPPTVYRALDFLIGDKLR